MYNKSWKVTDNKILHILAEDKDNGEVSFTIFQVYVDSIENYDNHIYNAVVQMTFNRDEFLCLTQAVNDQVRYMIEIDNQSVIDAVNKWLDDPKEE